MDRFVLPAIKRASLQRNLYESDKDGGMILREPRTLGLVAGLGVGAGIFYYRSLVDAHLAHDVVPRLVMVHADVRKVMRLAQERKAQQLAEYLHDFLQQLAAAGAELAAIPAFSPQICAAELAQMTPIPLVNLLDAIAADAARRKLQRVAVFGARVTMETRLFGKLQCCDVIGLNNEETNLVSQIYARLVEEAKASTGDYEQLRSLAHRVIERENLDAIVLGGTDLAFVFDEENTDFPHLDGARVHVRAIIDALLMPDFPGDWEYQERSAAFYASVSAAPRGSRFSSIFGNSPVSNPSAGRNEHT
jgi:aspartate racemase